jgi:hypothetical protein
MSCQVWRYARHHQFAYKYKSPQGDAIIFINSSRIYSSAVNLGFVRRMLVVALRTRPGSGFIFRAIVSSASPTYAVLLQHLYLHYPAGKNHVAYHFVDGIKMKDTVDVFVMDGTYCTGTYMAMPKGLKYRA